MAGLTDQGFVPKTYQELLAEMRARAVTIFQDLLVEPGDTVDTSDSTILGRLINLNNLALSDLWQVAQMVNAAFDPNSSTGIALDNLVALGGLVRQQQTFSTTQELLTGDNGTTLPSGLVFGSTVSAYQWELLPTVALTPTSATGVGVFPSTVADSTLYTLTYATTSTTNTISYTSGVGATRDSIIAGMAALITSSHPTLTPTITGAGSTGVLYVQRVDEFSTVDFTSSANLAISKVIKLGEVQATTVSPISADVNTITNILTPVIGLDSVTNIVSATLGRNVETDEELRERFRNAKFERASNIIESLYSALINLEGVEEVVIYENDTNTTNAQGVPAHSFMPILLGGVGSEIALKIWENKPMGIQSFGDTQVTIYDSQGYAHVIGYQRPDPVPIYISMTITSDPNFPASGPDQIKSAIIAYFDDNQGIGDDVVYSRLYTPINSVPNFQVDSLTIGTSPSPIGTSNIVIPFDALATISAANILINGV